MWSCLSRTCMVVYGLKYLEAFCHAIFVVVQISSKKQQVHSGGHKCSSRRRPVRRLPLFKMKWHDLTNIRNLVMSQFACFLAINGAVWKGHSFEIYCIWRGTHNWVKKIKIPSGLSVLCEDCGGFPSLKKKKIELCCMAVPLITFTWNMVKEVAISWQ